MSARCQLGLKSSQSMEQAMFFDETYVLEMPHLNQEPFSKGFVNSSFTQNSTMTNAISPSPAVSIPKSNSGYFGTEEYQGGGNQNELEFIAVTDLGFEDNFSSTLGACGGYGGDFDSPLSPSLWSPNPVDLKSDDMLSVNKNDLVQDPTLTQLNANEESLLDDLNDFDLPDLLPEDKSSISALSDFEDTKIRWDKYKDIPSAQESATCLTQNITQTKASIPFSTSVPTPSNPSPWLEQSPLIAKVKTEPKSEETNPCTKANVLTLEGLLSQYRTTPTFKPLMDVNSSSTNTSRLSSSAPANPGFDMWKGSHQNVLQSPPLLKADEPPKSTASVSSASTSDLYGTKDDFDSHDEGFDSEPEDTDHYEEFTSDAESTVSEDLDNRKTSASVSPSPKPSKKERFFWQYNVQAKGPKINRLCLNPRNSDPHLLNEVTDPVFSSICSVQGIKHSGKARRGDGNDLTPNARKLHQIGQELKKLNKIINDLTPVSELPFNARPKSRKEKNKLASRACRLKKKAQHEANKVKLYGLEHEHKKLLHCLKEVRKLLVIRVQEQENGKETEKLVPQMEKVLKTNLKTKIAGNTAEFVNQILARLSEGKGMTCLDDF